MAAEMDGRWDFAAERVEMVERQLVARGVRDDRVLAAMGEVPREAFVRAGERELAYADSALPIEAGQTISQPYVVALMAEALELGESDRVLEVGAGSGYAAAVLGRIAGEVYAIEYHEELASLAAERMRSLGYANVHVSHGDGQRGWPERAPFDAVAVAAGTPAVPGALKEQLASPGGGEAGGGWRGGEGGSGRGGRLVIPVGDDGGEQVLLRMRRRAAGGGADGEAAFETERLGPVRFVPLLGEG